MTSILLAIIIAFAAYKAGAFEGAEDKSTIDKNIAAGIKRDLDHTQLIIVRSILLAVGLAVIAFVIWWRELPFWLLLMAAPLAWGVFVPSHRYHLNTKRHKGALYMSTGNKYDLWWLCRAMPRDRHSGKAVSSKVHKVNVKNRIGDHPSVYLWTIQNAARSAYLFEKTVAVLSFIGFLSAGIYAIMHAA